MGESAELNDKAAGLFNTSYAIGCIIAPILGGYLNEIYGFKITCDIMAVSSLIFGVAYLIFRVILPCFLKKKPKVKEPSMVEANEKIQLNPKPGHSIYQKQNPYANYTSD